MTATLLNPDTPTGWLVARLKTHAPLVDLLGGEFIYQSGDVDDSQAAFVVVKPPVSHEATIYAEKYPQTGCATYLVFAETESHKLPEGLSLDEVLTPLFLAIQEALLGVDAPDAPSGGKAHSCEITSFYTPPVISINPGQRLQQKGVYVRLDYSG